MQNLVRSLESGPGTRLDRYKIELFKGFTKFSSSGRPFHGQDTVFVNDKSSE